MGSRRGVSFSCDASSSLQLIKSEEKSIEVISLGRAGCRALEVDAIGDALRHAVESTGHNPGGDPDNGGSDNAA